MRIENIFQIVSWLLSDVFVSLFVVQVLESAHRFLSKIDEFTLLVPPVNIGADPSLTLEGKVQFVREAHCWSASVLAVSQTIIKQDEEIGTYPGY